MERAKHIIGLAVFIFTLFINISLTNAQTSCHSKLYDAYVHGKMDKWYTNMKAFELTLKTDKEKHNLQLLNYYYGYAGWLVSEDNDDAEDYIDISIEILNKILSKEPNNATAHALMGAFIAFEFGLNPLKIIYLGRTSMEHIDKALEINPNNIQGLIEKGNALFYMPATFGGDKQKAINLYKKAISNIENQNLVNENWLYLNLLTTLSLAYEEIGDLQAAKLNYEKILKIEPEYMWVKDELYVYLMEKLKLN